MMTNAGTLGVIDSGIGGLSVVNALRSVLPTEEIVYLADPRHFPYGERSPANLRRVIQPFIPFFQDWPTRLLVTACGTVSSTCLPFLREEMSIPVMGIIEPGVLSALSLTRTGTLAILATNTTVRSGVFRQLIQASGQPVRVIEKAWPECIEAVERGAYHTAQWFGRIKTELASLRAQGADTVIMGCTHFSLISSFFQEAASSDIQIVDPARACAWQVKKLLTGTGGVESGTGQTHLFVRGDLVRFRQVIQRITDLTYHSLEQFPDRHENASLEIEGIGTRMES